MEVKKKNIEILIKRVRFKKSSLTTFNPLE